MTNSARTSPGQSATGTSAGSVRGRVIADGVLATKALVGRYLAGFDDSNRTRQAPHLPNHAAWCLGHLALILHRAAEKIDGVPPPESGFIHGDGRKGDATRFDTESVCFGSKPTDEPGLYPAWPRCVELFELGCDRFARAVSSCPDEHLDRTVQWGSGQTTLAALGLRMIFHNGDHTGQLADLRRALGMKSAFA